MELLYIWINQSENGFISKQGVNFNNKHKFFLAVTENPEKYVLSYTSAEDELNLFNENELINVTALVGENGAGKSTLFRCILNGSLRAKNEWSNNEEFEVEQYEKQKKIIIYRIGKNIEIFHNLPLSTFNSDKKFIVHNFIEANAKEKTRIYSLMEQQTIVYLSNSNFDIGFEGSDQHKTINKVNLTYAHLTRISNMFFKKIINENKATYFNGLFHYLQNILINDKSAQDFQQICDVLYYNNLYNIKKIETYLYKECKSLHISFINIITVLGKHRELFENNYEENEIGKNKDAIFNQILSERIRSFISWRNKIPKELMQNFFSTIYLNLIFELFFSGGYKTLDNFTIKTINDFATTINDLINNYQSNLKNKYSFYHDGKLEQEYYINSIHEIEILSGIINECNEIGIELPEKELSNIQEGKFITKNDGSDMYLRFCEFVDSVARNKNSFILKYVKIDNILMSSGERAYQNFFSWLNLLPNYGNYIEGESIQLNKSILFLIDEIDLYMHPNWQRQAIKTLLDELQSQYKENDIQIILSTHSPLVLSDIPKQNTIYLKPKNGLFNIEKNDLHPQTFGANIHTLLNDAFFLSNTMGSYAYEKIKEISDDLLKLRNNPENKELKNKCSEHKSLIGLIGEPLLRRKLELIYYECFPEKEVFQIEEYQRQIQMLKEMLQQSSISKKQELEIKEALQRALNILSENSENSA